MTPPVAVVPEAQRGRLNAAYRQLRTVTGLGPGLVKAYVLAAYRRQDAREAMARAHFGQGLEALGPGAKEAAEYWLRRLDLAANAVREPRAT